MKTIMRIYRPAQSCEVQEIDLPEDPGYRRLKKIIVPLLDGADLEHVAFLFEGRPADMFVDETSKIKGLPRNDEATAIYRANWLSRHPQADPESLADIAGTAIVFDRQVWF